MIVLIWILELGLQNLLLRCYENNHWASMVDCLVSYHCWSRSRSSIADAVCGVDLALGKVKICEGGLEQLDFDCIPRCRSSVPGSWEVCLTLIPRA